MRFAELSRPGKDRLEPGLRLREAVLYRGDAEQIEQFDMAKTDSNALFGPGLYLTTDPKVAHDYTAARGDERVFPKGRDAPRATTPKDLLRGYVACLAGEFDEKRFKDQWKRGQGIADPYAGMSERLFRDMEHDLDAAKQASAAERMPGALARVRSELPGLRVVKLTTGELVLVRRERRAAVSVFDIPDEYLARTLHGDRPLGDRDLKAIRAYWLTVFPRDNADLRDPGGNMVPFDVWVRHYRERGVRRAWAEDGQPRIGGKGENPSLDDLRNGTHSGYHAFVDSIIDDERKRSGALIALLRRIGYVGLEYDGGKRLGQHVRGGGGRLHRAFVFWDVPAVQKFRLPNAELPTLKGVNARSLPR